MRALGVSLLLFLALPFEARSSFLDPVDLTLLQFLGIEMGISSKEKDVKKCVGSEAPDWIPNTCNIASYLSKNIQPLNSIYSYTAAPQVIYFGETHISQASKHFLRDALPELKAQGFSVLGMEMFNISQQPILDKFFSGEESLEAVRKELSTGWGYELSGYMQLIEAAKINGIRILALDDRKSAPQNPLLDNILFRDQIMSARIATGMKKDPTLKVIVFSGSLHAQCSLNKSAAIPSQIERLSHLTGANIACFTIRERMRARDPVSEIYFQRENATPAFLPLERDNAYSDGYILLPTDY